MKRKLYLAYGSNLSMNQMKYRCPDAIWKGSTVILDHRLIFRRGFLTIEPHDDTEVPVGIWAISEEDEKKLDRYEGYPKFYRKQMFPVIYTRTDSKGNRKRSEEEGLIYIMNEGFPAENPSTSYLITCRDGYNDFGLNLTYLMNALIDTWEERNHEKA